MSAAMASDTSGRKIYIRLLDEGTDVSRPTEAVDIGGGLFRVLPAEGYDPEEEHWEFPPGSTVRLEKRVDTSGEYLVAVAPGS